VFGDDIICEFENLGGFEETGTTDLGGFDEAVGEQDQFTLNLEMMSKTSWGGLEIMQR